MRKKYKTEEYSKTDSFGSYGLCEYDYSSHTEPSGNYYGCITHIDRGWITNVNHSYIYYSSKDKNVIENIRDYCLDRYIRRNLTKESFEFVIHGGYYGDEPGTRFNTNDAEKFDRFIDSLNDQSITDSSLIESVLTDEYGFILDELKNKTWHFSKQLLTDVIPAAGMRHTSKTIIENYIKESSDVSPDSDSLDLTCLCQKIKNQYRLIDGYHRYSAAKKLNQSKIITIYCE